MATNSKKTAKNKVFDVEKPGKAKPPMGSKPMIVGHKSMAADPMVKLNEDENKSKATEEDRDRMAKNTSKLKIEPVSKQLKTAESEKPKIEDSPDEEVTKDEKVNDGGAEKTPEDNTDGISEKEKKDKKLEPAAVDMEREENLNRIIKSKKYHVDIKESRSGSFKTFIIVFLSLLVFGFMALFLLIDTGTIKSDIDLPFSIFGNGEETEQQTTSPISESAVEQEPARQKILELEEPILLQKLGDEEKLPEETPQSFVSYMRSKLSTIETDCPLTMGDDKKPGYDVTKISDRYMEGSGSCGGSGHMDWYLLNGVWNELPQQAYVECSKVVETTIPTEFMESCLSDGTQDVIDNPNGSYYDQEL